MIDCRKRSLLGSCLVTEQYTPIAFVECDGQQYIDLNYIVQETDQIEMEFKLTKTTSADKMLFGTVGLTSNTGLWFSHYSNTGYIRFGQSSSTTWSQVSSKTELILKKGNIWMGSNKTLGFSAMPDNVLYLFASHKDADPYSYGYCQCSRFAIVNTEDNSIIMELLPYRRDSYGAIGLLDSISGKFYTSDSEVPFISGDEV